MAHVSNEQMPFLAADVWAEMFCACIRVNGITSKGLYECFRCSIYGTLGWVFGTTCKDQWNDSLTTGVQYQYQFHLDKSTLTA